MDKNKQVGRLAMRSEGAFWNTYYAENDTMEDAILLASVRLSIVSSKEIKDAYIGIMSALFKDSIEELTGASGILMEPQPAPEHERAGNA